MGKEVLALQRDDPEWDQGAGTGSEGQAGLLDVLGKLPIFEMLTWRELRRVKRIVHRRHFEAGEVVIRPWAPRSGSYAILSGSVDVVRRQEDATPVVVGHVGEGELLGEFAILDDSPRSSSIVAAEPCELIGFFRPDLMDLIQTDPRLGFKILYRLSQIMGKYLRGVVGDLRRARSRLRPSGSALGKADPGN